MGEAAEEGAVGADGQEAHPRHAHQALRLEERVLGGEGDEAPAHDVGDELGVSLQVHDRGAST